MEHTLQFARHAAIQAGFATTESTVMSDQYSMRAQKLAPWTHVIEPSTPDPDSPGYRNWMARFIQDSRDHHPDSEMILLEADHLMPLLAFCPALTRRNDTVLLIRRPLLGSPIHRAFWVSVAKLACAVTLRLRGIHVLYLAPATPADRHNDLGRTLVPDPVTFEANDQHIQAYRDTHSMTSDRYWFGVFGGIHPRKNVDLVALALAAVRSDAVGLLLCGSIEPAEMRRVTPALDALRDAGGKVIVDSRWLPESELDAAIGAVDCAVVAHSSEGPSGIVGKSVAHGTRVIAAGPRSVRQMMKGLPYGTWTPLATEDLARAFSDLPPRPMPVTMCGPNEFASRMLRLPF